MASAIHSHWHPQHFFSLLVLSFHCYSYFVSVLITSNASNLHLPFLSLSHPTLLCFSVCFCLHLVLFSELLVCFSWGSNKLSVSLSLSPSLLPASVEEKEALKKNKSNCLLVSNSPRHPLQPSCLYPHPGGRRERRRDGGGCGSSSRAECVMYVWKAVHGGGGLAGWRRTLTPCASCQINHGSTWGSDLTSAWICNTEACTHTHTNTHTDVSSLQRLYMLTNKHWKKKCTLLQRGAFRLTVVLSENLHFKYANKSDIYHRNIDVNIP